jgi:hypothetical protein
VQQHGSTFQHVLYNSPTPVESICKVTGMPPDMPGGSCQLFAASAVLLISLIDPLP